MRSIVLLSLVAVAACSRPDGVDNAANGAGVANTSASASVSPEQQAAARVAGTYLDLISKRDFAKAHALWDAKGQAAGGSVADLEHAYAGYASFSAVPETPSVISTTDGEDHIVVTVKGTAVMKRNDEKRNIGGYVYLRRPAGQGDWRIWGVDVRRKK